MCSKPINVMIEFTIECLYGLLYTTKSYYLEWWIEDN